MGTKTWNSAGGTGQPTVSTSGSVTDAAPAVWAGTTLQAAPEEMYVDKIWVHSGGSGGSINQQFCLFDGSGNLLANTPGPGPLFGAGYGWNGDTLAALYHLLNAAQFRAGFYASGAANVHQNLGNGHYLLKENTGGPVGLSGATQDKFGNAGDLYWYVEYFPTAQITAVSSTPVAPGQTFTVTGRSFTAGITSVTLNGTNCPTYTVNSDTQLTVTVPAGATSGTVTVVTRAGTATSAGSVTVSQAYADNGTSFVQGATIYADNGTSFVTGTTVWSDNGSGWVQIG